MKEKYNPSLNSRGDIYQKDLISACCKVPMVIRGYSTKHFECSACGNATDPFDPNVATNSKGANLEKFLKLYKANLEAAVKKYPAEYGFNAAEIPTVFARMEIAIKNNTFNHSGRAFRETCVQIGIKHTMKEILKFIES